jgi:serine/threonine protein kinase
LLDGQNPNLDAAAPASKLKLVRLQRAFADLQWAELDPPTAHHAVLFEWGHLAVLESIGTGGFGEVFRAYDPMLQREVALKLRRAGNQIAPAAGRAFIEEARRLAQVRHANVLAVHGAAVHDGRAGIWTDLISGETLAARVQRSGPLSACALLAMLNSLASALAAVHARGIVHGDLTPMNVMCETSSERAVLMDFGGGASLDDRGETRLGAGSLHFMAPEQLSTQKLGTSADLYSLGATMIYAATRRTPDAASSVQRLQQRGDLDARLIRMLSALIDPVAGARPTALQLSTQCQRLLTAPERARRRQLRRALIVVLVFAMMATLVGLAFTLRARSQAEAERNRALAARDFLLTMVRNSNPYQTPNPTRRLDVMFENAIAALPAAFADDPHTEAVLLHQFGRSMYVFDRDEQALHAFQRADRQFAAAGVATSDPARIEARSFLSDVLRVRRAYPEAIALTRAQAELCKTDNTLPARACIAIVNDQIEATGFGGEPITALMLIDQNLARAQAALLEADYESVFTYYLAGAMRREAGQTAEARAAVIALTERSLTAVPAAHPGLLTDILWLAWCADDLGDVVLARELNAYALRGRIDLYGSQSRYSLEARTQAATLALHAGDRAAARAIAQTMRRDLDQHGVSAGNTVFMEQATLLAALADEPSIRTRHLDDIEQSRLAALGEASPRLAELRLGLAAVAIRAKRWTDADVLLTRSHSVATAPQAAALQPLYWQLRLDLESAGPHPESARTDAAEEKVAQLLLLQRRLLFDPARGEWVGAPVADAMQSIYSIRKTADSVFARRAGN